jgi:hypothetical protein
LIGQFDRLDLFLQIVHLDQHLPQKGAQSSKHKDQEQKKGPSQLDKGRRSEQRYGQRDQLGQDGAEVAQCDQLGPRGAVLNEEHWPLPRATHDGECHAQDDYGHHFHHIQRRRHCPAL